MKKITFISRRLASAMKTPRSAAIISIYDVSEPPLEFRPGWDAVLYLRFHDTDGQLMGLEVFSASQALQCMEFVENHRACDELVIHCEMGQSRSAAVALFLSEFLSIPCFKEQLPVTAMSYRIYNRKVYSVMHSTVHGEPGSAFAAMPVVGASAA